MTPYKLMLVDSNAYTAALLKEELDQRGFGRAQVASSSIGLPAQFDEYEPEAVIFNYHSDQPDSLMTCGTIRLVAPKAAVIVLASPGPARKQVNAWAAQTQSVDLIVEKPLSDQRFFNVLQEFLAQRHAARELKSLADGLANLVPEGAISMARSNVRSEGEMFEAAILFTDIRGSSHLILQKPPQVFFELLNEVLSAQVRHIGAFEGSVIKFTGDGVMAIFRGMGRSHLAMRCAIEMAKMSAKASMPFGVGVAQGLVVAGLIGDFAQHGHRRQYDVIGATAHLAARLCSMAEAGTVMCTRSISQAARLNALMREHVTQLDVRGFDGKIDCVVFNPSA